MFIAIIIAFVHLTPGWGVLFTILLIVIANFTVSYSGSGEFVMMYSQLILVSDKNSTAGLLLHMHANVFPTSTNLRIKPLVCFRHTVATVQHIQNNIVR